jgi:predicted O-methyltransferase YrrM
MSHPADGFTTIVHPEVVQYLDALVAPTCRLHAALHAHAVERGFPLVGLQSGRACELFARMVGARRVFEMGAGFGYSAYFFARAVGEGGMVIGAERDAHEIAAFDKLYGGHKFRARVDIRHGDAFEVLAAAEGSFDVIFLDLQKSAYPEALDVAVERLRPGGLLLADNVLWGGKVARDASDPDTLALQAFNRELVVDPRVEATILAVGDGLAVARRRG